MNPDDSIRKREINTECSFDLTQYTVIIFNMKPLFEMGDGEMMLFIQNKKSGSLENVV